MHQSLVDEVGSLALSQCKRVLETLAGDADAKDRMAAVRASVAVLEQVQGKRTVVEHLHKGRVAEDEIAVRSVELGEV